MRKYLLFLIIPIFIFNACATTNITAEKVVVHSEKKPVYEEQENLESIQGEEDSTSSSYQDPEAKYIQEKAQEAFKKIKED